MGCGQRWPSSRVSCVDGTAPSGEGRQEQRGVAEGDLLSNGGVVCHCAEQLHGADSMRCSWWSEGPQLCPAQAFSFEHDLVTAVNFCSCGSEGCSASIAAHQLQRSLPMEIREPDDRLGKMRALQASGGGCGMLNCAARIDCRVDPSGSGAETSILGGLACRQELRGMVRLGLQKEESVVGTVCLRCSAGSRLVGNVWSEETARTHWAKDCWLPGAKESQDRCQAV